MARVIPGFLPVVVGTRPYYAYFNDSGEITSMKDVNTLDPVPLSTFNGKSIMFESRGISGTYVDCKLETSVLVLYYHGEVVWPAYNDEAPTRSYFLATGQDNVQEVTWKYVSDVGVTAT